MKKRPTVGKVLCRPIFSTKEPECIAKKNLSTPLQKGTSFCLGRVGILRRCTALMMKSNGPAPNTVIT